MIMGKSAQTTFGKKSFTDNFANTGSYSTKLISKYSLLDGEYFDISLVEQLRVFIKLSVSRCYNSPVKKYTISYLCQKAITRVLTYQITQGQVPYHSTHLLY